MKNCKLVLAMALGAAACATSQVPVEVSAARSDEILLRVSTCATGGQCESGGLSGIHRGLLVFADADSLVMTDVKESKRVTIRPDSGVVVEMYRGQVRSAAATVEGAASGALNGAVAGAGEGLLVGGLSKILGFDVDVASSIKTGLIGGTAAGVLNGANAAIAEGKAVWERVTMLELRQQVCRCPNPDAPLDSRQQRLIPED